MLFRSNYKLKDYIDQNCRNDALKKRLIDCINGENIDDYFDDNSKEVEAFVGRLIAKIKEDAPNEKLKNELIGCVNIATRESPLTTISG